MVDGPAHVCSPPTRPVARTIAGFHRDQAGDWVAELSCFHQQHVRHRPPFQARPWVMSETGRTAHLDAPLDCPLCARAELPEGLVVVRTAWPFDAANLPPGLLASHLVEEGTWGCVHVIDGSVVFSMPTDPPLTARLRAGDRQPIPPGVGHSLTLDRSVRLTIDFLKPPSQGLSGRR